MIKFSVNNFDSVFFIIKKFPSIITKRSTFKTNNCEYILNKSIFASSDNKNYHLFEEKHKDEIIKIRKSNSKYIDGILVNKYKNLHIMIKYFYFRMVVHVQ